MEEMAYMDDVGMKWRRIEVNWSILKHRIMTGVGETAWQFRTDLVNFDSSEKANISKRQRQFWTIWKQYISADITLSNEHLPFTWSEKSGSGKPSRRSKWCHHFPWTSNLDLARYPYFASDFSPSRERPD
jgi:hypothetical protein